MLRVEIFGASPLAEGRELKYRAEQDERRVVRSPLAEGRELKFQPAFRQPRRGLSPLAEGRELKYYRQPYSSLCPKVAPRGGA